MKASTRTLSHLPVSLLLLSTCLGLALAQGTVPPQSLKLCTDDLAGRLGVPADQIKLARGSQVEFPDAALGLPDPDRMYAQVITRGCIVILAARNTQYLYGATDTFCRYGGPLDARQFSAVYLQQVENEPNLNGNLIQVSLAGTNPKVVLMGVSNYWPQPNGSVLASRRTSRSGFDLLYVAPDKYGEALKVSSAFDFGEAAASADGKRWVAYSRPQVGAPWQVSWGETKQAPQTRGTNLDDLLNALGRGGNCLTLPADTKPGRMYWHLTNPVALLHEADKMTPYELLLNEAKPRWQKFEGFFTPPTEEFMLNKSETLVVKTEKNDQGQPVTRVIKEWFTGDEKPVATITDFTPDAQMSLAGRRFLVLSGRRGEKTLGFTVDLGTGEVLETVKESDGPVRLLQAAPQGWIYSHLGGSRVITPG